MPYIRTVMRPKLEPRSERVPDSAGELNYQITRLINAYIQHHSRKEGVSYWILNAVIGALECAKLELYRRVAAVHEDAKCAENGDVYGR